MIRRERTPEMTDQTDQYRDMLYLPHKQSATRKHMSVHDRAAQFAPFAALTGYDSAIDETARFTEDRLPRSEADEELLNERVRFLSERIAEQPEITVTYFLPDERKAGGAYVACTGRVKRIEPLPQRILFTDGREIPLEDILAIESPLFPKKEPD